MCYQHNYQKTIIGTKLESNIEINTQDFFCYLCHVFLNKHKNKTLNNPLIQIIIHMSFLFSQNYVMT